MVWFKPISHSISTLKIHQALNTQLIKIKEDT